MMRKPTSKAVRRHMMEAAMQSIMRLPVAPNFISHAAEMVMLVVRTNPYPLSNHSFYNQESDSPSVSEDFSVQTFIPKTGLAYLSRLRSGLSPTTRDNLTSAHRLFLAAKIFAANNLSDTSPENKHWAKYSLIQSFGDDRLGPSIADVNLIEKQPPIPLGWNLCFRPDDLHSLVQPVLAAVNVPQLPQTTQSLLKISLGHASCIELPPGSFTKAPTNFAQHRLQQQRLRCRRKLRKGILQLTAQVLMSRVLTK
jgi:hypothetical protein